jgi:hypothetical protein
MGLLSGPKREKRDKPKNRWWEPIDPPPSSSYGDWGRGDAEIPVRPRPPVQPRAAVVSQPKPQRSADPRIRAALEVIYEHGETDDPETLKWVIDQMVYKLHTSKEEYEVWVMMYNRRPAMRDWTQGTRP